MDRETKYAQSDGLNIAYQVAGQGPFDLVFVMGWVSNIDMLWEGPSARFLERLASFSRLILFDKRGTGLSDRVTELPTIEQRMDDVRAVMDAAGSDRAALLGISEGAAMCACFAATYPERTTALAMYGAYAKRTWDPDYPWAPTEEQREAFFQTILREWGGVVDLETLAPGTAKDPAFRAWWATYLQQSASPGAAVSLAQMNSEIDIRHVLPAIRVPTLVLHRVGDLDIAVGGARYMATKIPDARYIEMPGDDHLVFAGDQDAVLVEIEQFLTGVRPAPLPETVLATILFAEIVEAMVMGASLGETVWQAKLTSYDRMVGEELARFRGHLVRSTTIGFIATFDGPARAIRCARAIVERASVAGLNIRAGLHTGECEIRASELGGLAVQIASRVMSRSGPGEVLVSRTVTDLVAGSGIDFERQEHRLTTSGGQAVEVYRVAVTSGGGVRPTVPSTALPKGHTTLSPRETEIAVLVGRGYSNRAAADELSISVATVERHVANIFNKLSVHSRSQIAAWVVAGGMLHVGPDSDQV